MSEGRQHSHLQVKDDGKQNWKGKELGLGGYLRCGLLIPPQEHQTPRRPCLNATTRHPMSIPSSILKERCYFRHRRQMHQLGWISMVPLTADITLHYNEPLLAIQNCQGQGHGFSSNQNIWVGSTFVMCFG